MKKYSLMFAALLLLSGNIQAQTVQAAKPYGIILKGGHVIDPKNNINEVMDVAIIAGRPAQAARPAQPAQGTQPAQPAQAAVPAVEGKIGRVAKNIDPNLGVQVINVSGMYVTPGHINIHTHVFVGNKAGYVEGTSSQLPDAFAIRSGITTVVDAGTSGWRNFPTLKATVIDPSVTRVLAFLNIAAAGYSVDDAQENIAEMDVQQTSETVKKYPGVIVGVRIGRYEGADWAPFDRAVKAAEIAGVPLLVECHLPQYSLEGQLQRMRPGDIITHAFENVRERATVVDDQGQVRPVVKEAQKRGILFDVGHGGAGFWFNQAIPAMKQGLFPNSFGTDEHRTSVNSGMKTIVNVMSKYLNMGMSIQDIIARASWYPAKSIKREDLGNLSEGSVADISVLSVVNGKFGFVDSGNNKIEGDRKLENEMTIRAGRVVWDLNGLNAAKYTR